MYGACWIKAVKNNRMCGRHRELIRLYSIQRRKIDSKRKREEFLRTATLAVLLQDYDAIL
jgi:hypothetical protein